MSWMERAARGLALIDPSRRRRIALTVAVFVALFAVQEISVAVTGGRRSDWSFGIILLFTVLVHLVGRVTEGMSTGRYAGRPLDLPRARMIRDAARHYGRVTSWTSPLTAEEALARLTERMRVPELTTRAYDGALWIRLVQKHEAASPADPDQQMLMTVAAEVLVFVDDLQAAPEDGWYRPGARAVVTVHHGPRRATGPGATVTGEPRRVAVMTDHLLIAIRDATGG